METRQTRLEQNQALFLEGEDMIEDRAERQRVDFVCECEDSSCLAQLPLTIHEYKELRKEPGRYAVAPGHESSTDQVVETNDRYVVVTRT